jgi:flagellar M-ring protein FliF
VEAALNLAKNFGLVRLAVISATLLAMTGGFFYFLSYVSKPELALLYSDLDLADANKIVSKIEGMGIDVEVRGGGSQVYVPVSKVGRLRMEMAEHGLPRGGSVGYEIFDRDEPLGTSGFIQNINHLRALEGELARTIGSLAQVNAARVHLVLPKRELFSRDKEEPSASIILRLNGTGRLSQAKVRAIQHIVAAAVPRLVPERVSIVDDQGNLLASVENNDEAATATSLEEMRLSYENRLTQSIVHLLEKYVGVGKVSAEVHTEMDMDRIVENSEIFSPDGQVVRSTQNIEEGQKESEGGKQAATVENQLPGGASPAGSNASQSNRNEQVVNYEISKTHKQYVKEIGGVKKVSVAVMVDGIYTKEGTNPPVYKARSKEEMDQLAKLVQTAVGFDEKRGDHVEVLNMQFSTTDIDGPLESAGFFLGLTKPEIVRIIEVLTVGLVGLLMLLLVFKPIITRILESVRIEPLPMREATDAVQALPASEQVSAISGPGSPQEEIQLKAPEAMSANTIEQVGKMVEEQTDEAVTIVRSWMAETA